MKPLSWLFCCLFAVTVINYPNPFNPKAGQVTTIEGTSDTTQETTLFIYDLSARLLYRRDLSLPSGVPSRLVWNGYSDFNDRAGNGVYVYQLINRQNQRIARGKIWVVNK